MKIIKTILIFCCLFFIEAKEIKAFESKNEVYNLLSKIYSSRTFKETLRKKYQSSTHVELYTDYTTDILQNENVINSLTNYIYENKSLLKNNPNLAAEFGAQWAISNALRGITRLSDEDQRFFLKMGLFQISVLSDADCKKIAVEDLSNTEMQNLEIEALNIAPKLLVEEYLRIMKRATYAEINDSPLKRTLNVSENEIAEATFVENYSAAIDKHDDYEKIIEAAINPALSEDYYVCKNMKILFQSLLDAPGITGTLAIRQLISQMY